MALDELLITIETLQGRIAGHGAALRQNEALTRYALIDPLLRALDWDTGDPSQVLVEFRSPAGSADYALLSATGQPQIIVEAKKLGSPLQNAMQQVINYCIRDGYEHFAVTDGQIWQVYKTNRSGRLEDKLVVQIDLNDDAATTCLRALALWKPAVSGGSIAVSPTLSAAPPIDEPAKPTAPSPTPDARLATGAWHRLTDFNPKAGAKPAAVRLPDGSQQTATSWIDFSTAIVTWLKSTGRLTVDSLPIRIGNSKTYFVNTTNDRSNGQPFVTSRQVGDWFVNGHYGAEQQMKNARELIKITGLDPADFAVQLNESSSNPAARPRPYDR